MGKAAIEVREEGGEEGGGPLRGADAREAELDDEAILQGPPEALDPAFGLRRAGRDVPDPELPQDAAELGRMLGALQFFVERPVGVVADEDAEAIAVEDSGATRGGPRVGREG